MAKKVHAEVRKRGQHLTEQNRYDIERYLKMGWSKKQIAEAVGCCSSKAGAGSGIGRV